MPSFAALELLPLSFVSQPLIYHLRRRTVKKLKRTPVILLLGQFSRDLDFLFTMCSVLQRPIPSAPLFLAFPASAGVSAFAITCMMINQSTSLNTD